MIVRTRFAPSPTGQLHIGGARTALFGYLWAKKQGGSFILRIEDTDAQRFVDGSVEGIIRGLRWLGIDWDEGPLVGGDMGPYVQSERLALYKEQVAQLVQEKKAYYCFCTPERLHEMREEQKRLKKPPRYDRTCAMLTDERTSELLSSGVPVVIRLLVPREQDEVVVHDVIRGEVRFKSEDIDDQVLLKSDGFPTYHLANVVDDHFMKITHVIRGEEWLPSTPKHVLLYNAFGWDVPEFAHLSLFLSKEGGKMSKRHGETALEAFMYSGYLPEAVVNFMVFLGWNPKTTEEFFTLEELKQRFELTQINKANPVFDTQKLDWLNSHYLKQLSLERFQALISELSIHPFNPYQERYTTFKQWFEGLSVQRQSSILPQILERSVTLLDAIETVQWVGDTVSYDASLLVWKKSDPHTAAQVLQDLIQQMDSYSEDQFTIASLESLLRAWIAESGRGNGDVLWPLRVALSGHAQSPSPFELAELLGKEKTIHRLRQAHELLTNTL